MIKEYEQRLQKIIANSGYCSRRKAEELILQRRVKVNGIIINEVGTKFYSSVEIMIDDEIINKTNKKLYLLFNKPINCLTTTNDPLKRKTVLHYFKDISERIYPVGRLDYKTSGLLILTNDGELANIIMHPKYEIDKKYDVIVKGKFSNNNINKLLNGIIIDKNFLAIAKEIQVIKVDNVNCEYRLLITISDGHNHQIRKMIKAIDGGVLKLERVSIAFLTLDNLSPGQYRNLNTKEINKLFSYSNK